jgi:hypothetical protein
MCLQSYRSVVVLGGGGGGIAYEQILSLLHLLDEKSKIPAITVFVLVDLQIAFRILRIWCVYVSVWCGIFIRYLHVQ